MSTIYCRCRACDLVTKHQPTTCAGSQEGIVACEVCGRDRWYAKKFGAGDFPELTDAENEVIHEARTAGFGSCFPCFPDAETQARRTFEAARLWLLGQSV